MNSINCLHSHILPGVDDGAKTLEDSLNCLLKAQEQGITNMVLTPHYIEDTIWDADNTKKNKLFKVLVEKAKLLNININLYLGNEVYVTDKIIDLLKSNKIMTINNSRYILIELPLNSKLYGIENILKNIIDLNYIPIIAHPERYKYELNFDFLLNLGVLFQGNYLSLFNKYGKSAKVKLVYLLKNKIISILGSDSHNENTKYKMNETIIYLKEKIKLNNDYIREITQENFYRIIKNESIEIEKKNYKS
ncbi:MAG: CpsB/CapC family capsule biosynthesis tyrosine phosphatase [Bacilli bacterium]